MTAPALGQRRSLPRLVAAAFLLGAMAGGVLAAARSYADGPVILRGDDAALKAKFRRPDTVPFPAADPFSEPKRALGERLFFDTGLSIDGSIACATCHQIGKGLGDGRVKSTGVPGQPLARHTASIWNLAWAAHVFWDGRARSLEEQVAGPIENPDEMDQRMGPLLARLAGDPGYAGEFAKAFPADPKVTEGNLAKAIATYMRMLVSPVTRFDRWIGGDAQALTPQEAEGFSVFTGKAHCVNCHSGWAFTDYAFHDIGLPSEDRGRGAVLRLAAAEHAFKTPSLRETGRSAPYMHDGSLPSLDAVLRHYENGIVDRSTLSPDLPRGVRLNESEKAALIAFLGTLTGENPEPAKIVAATVQGLAPAEHVTTVSQRDKTFSPTHLAVKKGGRIWIVNNDTRTHNVRVFDPKLDVDSGAQEPGETVELAFPKAGSFLVFCGIHPKMELTVDVAP